MMYEVKVVSDGNPSDLSEENLATLEPMELDMEMKPGNRIGVNLTLDGKPIARIIYLVLAVWSAEKAGANETLILLEIERPDIVPSKTTVKIENSVSMKMDLGINSDNE